MNKYLFVNVCFFMIVLLGCSATLEKKADKESADVVRERLEKRIDDLSGTITLVVNDSNRLHNKLEDLKLTNKTLHEKMKGFEESIKTLGERIAALDSALKTSVDARLPEEEAAIIPKIKVVEKGESSDEPVSHIQEIDNSKELLSVANGFWDAMNAKDMQAVRSYATKGSADKLQMKDTDSAANCTVTFGEVTREGDKGVVETVMQTNEGATTIDIQMKTILQKENNQWKVDVEQTMMSMFGGAMGEMIKGLGKAMEEGFKKGFEEMGKSMSEDVRKGLGETTETGEIKADSAPQKQSAVISRDMNDPVQRELFLKENIVRLAESQFPNNKGLQWNIISMEHKAHLTYVEAEPVPANLDYPRFKFNVSFKDPASPRVIGMFCLKDGQYILFSAKK